MQSQLVAVSADEEALLSTIAPTRMRLAQHPLYASIRSLRALQIFMESHVFAVWDFMSLLKALQRALTCVNVPWLPTPNASSRRLINEIVLGEESDEYQGEALSHFELYLRAMESCGADPAPVRAALAELASGVSLEGALVHAPREAAVFVRATFETLATGATHRVAAAFTFGREDLIPAMFSAFVRHLDAELPGRIAPFRYYLERHIEMDGEDHGPMAMQMMRQTCLQPEHWTQAAETAKHALEARLALWDCIHRRILAT